MDQRFQRQSLRQSVARCCAPFAVLGWTAEGVERKWVMVVYRFEELVFHPKQM